MITNRQKLDEILNSLLSQKIQNKIVVDLEHLELNTNEEIEIVIGVLEDELVKKGFDADKKITDYGRQVESIISLFSNRIYSC